MTFDANCKSAAMKSFRGAALQTHAAIATTSAPSAYAARAKRPANTCGSHVSTKFVNSASVIGGDRNGQSAMTTAARAMTRPRFATALTVSAGMISVSVFMGLTLWVSREQRAQRVASRMCGAHVLDPLVSHRLCLRWRRCAAK
jgi:hypothetical protein